MAVACGIAVANLYYNQPLLALMAADLGTSHQVIGLVPTATQVGYALGLLLLVPLGDIIDRRKLILLQSGALMAALAVMALAPYVAVVLAASVAVGVASTIAQQIIPFAAAMADERSRGQVVGIVMSGLLGGILLARTVSGFVGEYFGWRAAYVLGVVLTGLLALAMARLLPRGQGGGAGPRPSYLALLASLGAVARRHPVLVKASLVQATQFWSFSAFWSTLALHLEGPAYGLGADIAGLFGILALVGVLAAPVAGRLADRYGAGAVITVGLAAVGLGFLDFTLVPGIPGLIIGVVLFDFGVQLSMVAHQARIFALEPAARSRINTVFMTTLFTAGAISSAVATVTYAAGGWLALTLSSVAVTAVGLALHLLWRPQA
ncbi:MFS transporter [Zavarzinia compransoris]|uniref:MFS transporter n=2 Tax=Zavarzinia compransoris TaxID=1264899 RepID=A0A317EBV9_9PROT|nr:MFS transporter [Zavarzinia compransoris]